MTEDFLQLKNENILRFGIKDDKGKPTGDYLEFDLEDIELPLIYQELTEKNKKNRIYLKNQLLIIDKKEDHKGKKILSSNDEAKCKAFNDFYRKETEIYNMFLGENGVQKLLHGRKLRWTTLNEIDEMIEKIILPKLNITMDDITKKIKEKYSTEKEEKVLE